MKHYRVVMLTALPIEYRTVRSHLYNLQEKVYKGTIYEQGKFLTQKGHWNVGIAQIGIGNSGAAAETERALAYFKPKFIFLVGVAGGINDVEVGDVVVATKVYGYESGKIGETGLLVRPEIGQSSYQLVQRAQAEAHKEGWKLRIQPSLPDASTSPRIFVGPIAAGEKVLSQSESDIVAFLHTTYNDTLAVEMEGAGFLQAVWRNEPVQALIVRGISNLLDNKRKRDTQGNQILAVRHASAFAFEILAALDYPQESEPIYKGRKNPRPSLQNVQSIERGNIAIGSNVINIVMPLLPHRPEKIVAAYKLLAQMPDETLPDYGDLPLGSQVTYRRNKLFVGREGELHTLSHFIKGNKEKLGYVYEGTIVALTGIGGIGKTQLACEFIYRYGQFFAGGVFWLDCRNMDLLPEQVASCGEALASELHLHSFRALPLKERVKQTMNAWESSIPRLLVFDDCEDEHVLRQWCPSRGGSQILITSRKPNWSKSLGIQVLPLHMLERVASIQLLSRFCSSITVSETMLDKIAEEIGDHPLALHLAGCYLERYQYDYTPVAYLAQLQDTSSLLKHTSLQQGDLSPTNHDQNVWRTFYTSYESLLIPFTPNSQARASSVNEYACVLLTQSAFFAPGVPIPRSLLHAAFMSHREQQDFLFADALNRLVELGLVEIVEEGMILIHKLLAQFARDSADTLINEVAQKNAENTIVRILLGMLPMTLPAQAHLYIVITEAFERYCSQRRFDDALAVQVAIDPYLLKWGALAEVVQMHERLRGKITLPRLSLLSLMHLGNAYELQGNTQQAKTCYSDGVENARQWQNDTYEAAFLGLLANLLQTEDSELAIDLYQQALAIARTTGNQSMQAKWLANLGICYSLNGMIAQALKIYHQVFEIAQEIGARNISSEIIAQCRINLGVCYALSGKTEQASSEYEKALRIALETENRLMQAKCWGNLAECQIAYAHFQAATNYLEKALALCQQDDYYPVIGNLFHSKAELSIDEGHLDEALIWAQQGCEIGRKINDTAIIIYNQTASARAYLYREDFTHAYEAAQKAQSLAIPHQQHYATLLLAIIELKLGKIPQAIQMFDKAFEQASTLLDTYSQHYTAYYTQSLALYGKALCSGYEDKESARLFYEKARALNRDQGIVSRVHRLFGSLGWQEPLF